MRKCYKEGLVGQLGDYEMYDRFQSLGRAPLHLIL